MQPNDLERYPVNVGCSEWMSVSTTVKLRCNVVQRKWVKRAGTSCKDVPACKKLQIFT